MQFCRNFYLSLQYYKTKQFSVSTYLVNFDVVLQNISVSLCGFQTHLMSPPLLMMNTILILFLSLIHPQMLHYFKEPVERLFKFLECLMQNPI